MMGTLKKIVKQALITFSDRESSLFPTHFEKLISLTENLNEKDVCLDEETKRKKGEAPVTFINLYESQAFTLGIFIIRKGKSLPLHDHPGMVGVCKPLYGTLQFQSYQKVDTLSLDEKYSKYKNTVVVKKLPEKILKYEDGCKCEILTPVYGNYHTISAIKEDSAIFDILAPPYSNTRDCNYYKVVSLEEQIAYGLEFSQTDTEKGLTLLREVSPPQEFYCDSEDYKGPTLDLDEDI